METKFRNRITIDTRTLTECQKKIDKTRFYKLIKMLNQSVSADSLHPELMEEHDNYFEPRTEPERDFWYSCRELAKEDMQKLLKSSEGGKKSAEIRKQKKEAPVVQQPKEENKYFELFVEWWNSKFYDNQYNSEDNIPKISVINQKRKVAFKSRWTDTKNFMTKNKGLKPQTEAEVYDFIRKNVIAYNYANSDFLQGKIKGYNHAHGYEFSFDSIFAPGMWTKLLENKFINKE